MTYSKNDDRTYLPRLPLTVRDLSPDNMHICKSWIANPTFTLKLLLYYRALIYCPLPLIFTAINYYFWHPQITPLPLFLYISNNPVAKGKETKSKFQTIFKPPTPFTNKNRSIWGLCEKKGGGKKKNHQVLELMIFNTSISIAPQAVNSSITVATLLLSTVALTATQPSFCNGSIVGDVFPGVILVASDSLLRSMLYLHRTYF